MTSRRTFITAAAVVAAATGVPPGAPAAAATAFDRAAFEARARLPFRHRQAFAAARVADGAVLGFMYNSLNAYETGFGEGPGTLHAAAVLYHTGVALALDDDAWRTLGVADAVRKNGDRISAAATDGHPFLRSPQDWAIVDLQRRHASFFVCQNALGDLARRLNVTLDALQNHLLPGMMMVPAGVAAVNALQEEHFTLFTAEG
jgi:intracellular sulfur oxidation DsrE/DsrF family protein